MLRRFQLVSRPMSQQTTNSSGSTVGTINKVNLKSFEGLTDIFVPMSGRFLGLFENSLKGLGCSAERNFPRFQGARVRTGRFPWGGLIF